MCIRDSDHPLYTQGTWLRGQPYTVHQVCCQINSSAQKLLYLSLIHIFAGCWVHMRRRFEQALQVIPKGSQKGTVSYIAMKQIQACLLYTSSTGSQHDCKVPYWIFGRHLRSPVLSDGTSLGTNGKKICF